MKETLLLHDWGGWRNESSVHGRVRPDLTELKVIMLDSLMISSVTIDRIKFLAI